MLIYSKSISLFCITETWLHENILDNEIIPPGYKIYRRDRKSRGGGILIAIDESIISRIVTSHPTIELLAIEVETTPKMTVICLYIPPNSSNQYQQHVLDYIISLPDDTDTMILGDLNTPDINWDTLTSASTFSNSLCSSLYSHNFIQLVKEATHIHGNILDVIITNAPYRLNNTTVHNDSDLKSDHYLVTSDLLSHESTCPHTSVKHKVIFLYHSQRINYEEMEDYLFNRSETFTRASASTSDINCTWRNFKTLMNSACNLFIPTLKLSNKPSPKWFNSNVRHHLNRVHTLRRKHHKVNSNSISVKLSSAEADLEAAIANAKDKYMQNLVSSFRSNPHKLFNHLKQLRQSKFQPKHITDDNHIPITDRHKIAEEFNNFFHSTFSPPSNFFLPDVSNLPTPSRQLNKIDITKADIFEAMQILDVTKTTGCDRIHPKVLKMNTLALLDPIYDLFSTSLQQQTLPLEWKTHKICPVPKKGDRLKVSNYRPISLLCILSKVLESIIYQKIIDFVLQNISEVQFGFIKGRSCLSQLISSFSLIHNALDNKQVVDAVYLDFSKAFDSVSHQELLYKLWRFGITGPLWHWFRNYLTDRSHFVYFDGEQSQSLPVLSGVPQGSILGPLLFTIFINDLPDSISHASCFMFADDVKLIQAIASLQDEQQLQLDIDSVTIWCQVWNMYVNHNKCNTVRFSTKKQHNPSHYYVSNNEIQHDERHKDLGLTIDGLISWSEHYNNICRKAYSSLNLIRRSVSPTSPLFLKKQPYLALVKSHLTYCCQLWRPRYVKDVLALERVQRKATKFILNDYSSGYKQRLLSLNMLPLMYWYELQDLIF